MVQDIRCEMEGRQGAVGFFEYASGVSLEQLNAGRLVIAVECLHDSLEVLGYSRASVIIDLAALTCFSLNLNRTDGVSDAH